MESADIRRNALRFDCALRPAGQRMLVALAEDLPALAQKTVRRADSEDWENFTPGMTLASCQHEAQYTRLFRS